MQALPTSLIIIHVAVLSEYILRCLVLAIHKKMIKNQVRILFFGKIIKVRFKSLMLLLCYHFMDIVQGQKIN